MHKAIATSTLSFAQAFLLADRVLLSPSFVTGSSHTSGCMASRTSLRAGISAWVDALLDTSFVPARDKDEMFRQRIDTPAQTGIPIVQGVGYGWFTSKRNDVTMLWHDGSRGGARTAVVLVPNARLGIVVLSNLESTDPLELVTLVVDRALSTRR